MSKSNNNLPFPTQPQVCETDLAQINLQPTGAAAAYLDVDMNLAIESIRMEIMVEKFHRFHDECKLQGFFDFNPDNAD